MKISFTKYHGAGNDFIIIDNRMKNIHLKECEIMSLCHRRFGIGADGLILLENDDILDFKMRYYNADGRESSMCGNGGRCIAAFAADNNIINNQTTFIAHEMQYSAKINKDGTVKLKMQDVLLKNINREGDIFILDTGSPHYVMFYDYGGKIDFFIKGKEIRNSKRFVKEGINVNFVAIKNDELYLTTYERGVENLTYSCGTGTVAATLSYALLSDKEINSCIINTLGGSLKVYFKQSETKFSAIYLEAATTKVFHGCVEINALS